MKKTIVYSPTGTAYSDADAEDCAKAFLKSPEEGISVSTENFITAVRVMIHEGLMPHEDVVFKFNDQVLQPDKNGRLMHWPAGFCDTMDKMLSRLLAPR